MARALIVGCGGRGRALGERLLAQDWAVRGTSRSEAGRAAIKAVGIEPAAADPAWPGTILDLVADVTTVYWLMGSAQGDEKELEALHGERLEHLLLRLVDTPVRSFVYEAAGTAPDVHLRAGRAAVARAASTWRIPVAAVEADPARIEEWVEAMLAAALAPPAANPRL